MVTPKTLYAPMDSSQAKLPRELPLTVLIATKNEEANLTRCLAALGPAQRVVVVDSFSQDSTPDIVRRVGAELVNFQYHGGYPKKRQWALDLLVADAEWVLLLDADEVVPPRLWCEIAEVIVKPPIHDAYFITKGFHFLGRRFRFGGFSHAAVLLFRKGKARFEELGDAHTNALDMEVHERVIVDGSVGKLKTALVHEDFKGIEAYIARHNQYSTWDANVRYYHLGKSQWGSRTIQAKLFGNTQERRRFIKKLVCLLPFESGIWFLYHYFIRLGFLEGRPGLIAARIRSHYIFQVRAKLYELKKWGKQAHPEYALKPANGRID